MTTRHTLYTIVNRAGQDLPDMQLRVPPDLAEVPAGERLLEAVDGLMWPSSARFFDCYHGVELRPRPAPPMPNRPSEQREMTITLDIEQDGYGCALMVSREGVAGEALHRFLTEMAALTQTRLGQHSSQWQYLPQTLVPIARTAPALEVPEGMVRIPATKNYLFVVRGLEIEPNQKSLHGVDVQFAWEKCACSLARGMGRRPHHAIAAVRLGGRQPQRNHNRSMQIDAFYMDKYPATNADYYAYLNATGYKPKDTYRWLRHWGASMLPSSCPACSTHSGATEPTSTKLSSSLSGQAAPPNRLPRSATVRSRTFRSARHDCTVDGRMVDRDYPTSGSGNTPRRGTISGSIPGARARMTCSGTQR